MALQPCASGASPDKSAASGRRTPAAILVLDEDAERRERTARCLLAAGYYDVHVADDPTHALELIRGASPELMILGLDVTGTRGIDFLHSLRSDLSIPHFPVIVMTRGEEYREAKDPGIALCVSRPFVAQDLLRLVSEQFAAHATNCPPAGNNR